MAGEEVFVASAIHTTALAGLFLLLWLKENPKSILKTAWLFGVFLVFTYSLLVEDFAFGVTGVYDLRGVVMTFYQIMTAIIMLLAIYAILKFILDVLNALAFMATGHRIYGEEESNDRGIR